VDGRKYNKTALGNDGDGFLSASTFIEAVLSSFAQEDGGDAELRCAFTYPLSSTLHLHRRETYRNPSWGLLALP
jgi:hypothetical protein